MNERNNFNENFWIWFGNSKVIDNSGNPLIVYHGTEKSFNTFKLKNVNTYSNNVFGYFFTSNRKMADLYSNQSKKSIVMSVFLKMDNPYLMPSYEYQLFQNYKTIEDCELFIEKLKNENFDGIISGDNYIVFESNQIKSINNTGSYSLKSDNINEYKNIGNLYHIVDIEKLFYILRNNKISSKYFQNISTTRDKMMGGYIGDSSTSVFKLEFDSAVLSNNYKMKPFSYKSQTNIYFDEKEEQIQTNEIKNIKKYINKIIINKKRLEYLKDSGWFNTDGGFVVGKGKISFPEIFKELINLIDENGLRDKLYVQTDSTIKKDDEYIQSVLDYSILKIHHGYCYYIRGFIEGIHPKFGMKVLQDDILPVDDRNKKIETLVIGHDYEYMWLHKKSYPVDVELPEGYSLYEFDFKYKLEDVISEDNNFIYLKTTILRHIKKIKS
jgi:hypothetical protein